MQFKVMPRTNVCRFLGEIPPNSCFSRGIEGREVKEEVREKVGTERNGRAGYGNKKGKDAKECSIIRIPNTSRIVNFVFEEQ